MKKKQTTKKSKKSTSRGNTSTCLTPEIEARVTGVTIAPPDVSVGFSQCTHLRIEVSGDGDSEVVVVEQQSPFGATGPHNITIVPEQWGALRGAINFLLEDCRAFAP